LDGRDKNDQSVKSSEEDEYGEEVEFDKEPGFINDSSDEDGDVDGDEEDLDDFDEEGEDDLEEEEDDDESEEVQAPASKRVKK